jgi:hypothetical protein
VKLNAPKRITWIIALVVGIVGLLGLIVSFFGIPILGAISPWLIAAALALSLASNVVTGL